MRTVLVAAAGVASAYGAHRVTAVSATALVSLPFQSGWAPEEHALSRYHVRWYLATLVFLAFDVGYIAQGHIVGRIPRRVSSYVPEQVSTGIAN
ncbi:NADH-quinone oxidoreductase subunit A [Mycolicibacterium chlorophenolicum]